MNGGTQAKHPDFATDQAVKPVFSKDLVCTLRFSYVPLSLIIVIRKCVSKYLNEEEYLRSM